jgi:hypothetical protein
MEQTAVEWLFENVYVLGREMELGNKDLMKKFNQSKEMEKEKMIDFAFNFYYDFCNKTGVPFNLITENRTNVEDYYNRTFKSE